MARHSPAALLTSLVNGVFGLVIIVLEVCCTDLTAELANSSSSEPAAAGSDRAQRHPGESTLVSGPCRPAHHHVWWARGPSLRRV
jgi:hypothetical protein